MTNRELKVLSLLQYNTKQYNNFIISPESYKHHKKLS